MEKEKVSGRHKLLTIIGTILCIILVPILLINITLIIKSFTDQDEVPSIGGIFPMIVLTDSMYPEIHSGDLIICKTAEPEEVQTGDIISFFDPMGNGTSVVTHRAIEIVETDGELYFRTQGDYNNTADKELVGPDDLIGIYKSRIPGAGNIAMFMQSTAGLIVCVVLPILLLVGYDVIRRRRYEQRKQDDNAALLAELELLRAEKAKKEIEEKPVESTNED